MKVFCFFFSKKKALLDVLRLESCWPKRVLQSQLSNKPHMDSALTSKGQATIPKAVRDHLGLKPGDRVKFFMHPDGSVVLLPTRPVTGLRALVRPRPGRAVTLEDMQEAIASGGSRRRG
jgi:AbrB family looped-hinge helix DNA binding protein